jgi:hypothetical protein
VQEYVFLSMRKTTNCGAVPGESVTTRIAPLDVKPRFIAPMEATAPSDPLVRRRQLVWFNGIGFKPSRTVAAGPRPSTSARTRNGVVNSTTALPARRRRLRRLLRPVQQQRLHQRPGPRLQGRDGKWTGVKLPTTTGSEPLPVRVWVTRANTDHVVVAVNGFNRRFTEGPGSADVKATSSSRPTRSDLRVRRRNLPDVPADDVILTDGGRTAYVATDLGVVRASARLRRARSRSAGWGRAFPPPP